MHASYAYADVTDDTSVRQHATAKRFQSSRLRIAVLWKQGIDMQMLNHVQVSRQYFNDAVPS